MESLASFDRWKDLKFKVSAKRRAACFTLCSEAVKAKLCDVVAIDTYIEPSKNGIQLAIFFGIDEQCEAFPCFYAVA